jgi:2,5-diamino-6-(ribosylamino)-4(3H)-pyrimidinone 5'-phosphate reductase
MRPYVTINIAMSADGKISTRQRRQVRISGREDFLRVDQLKARSDAVMVGIGTVLADDPSLTVKGEELRRHRVDQGMDPHPIRIVIDSRARIPIHAEILHKGEGKRVVAVSREAPPERVREIEKWATVITAGESEVDLEELFTALSEMGIRALMVEGGGTLIWSLFQCDLVDEMYCYIGNIVIGGREAPTPAEGAGFLREEEFARLKLRGATGVDEGVLLHWEVVPK